MHLSHRPTKLLVTGKSGSGKTTYLEKFLANARYDWRLVFDAEGEFCYRTGWRSAGTAAELVTQLQRRRWAVFDPAPRFPGRTEDGFRFFCEWCFALAQRLPGKKLFACDELQKWAGTQHLAWELACVVETGRRYALDCVFVSQQPNLVHNRLRNQLTEVVTFAQADANALSFLRDVGFEESAVRQLPPGAYLARNLNSGAGESGRLF